VWGCSTTCGSKACSLCLSADLCVLRHSCGVERRACSWLSLLGLLLLLLLLLVLATRGV
jgi:hypothetical protein